MLGRFLEITDDGCHLARERGFLIVRREGREHLRIPLDDLAAVIANAHGMTYSHNLLVALAERAVPFVVAGPDHNVRAMLIGIEGHHLQARRFDAQIAASRPLRKRAWAQLVKAKILQQAAVIEVVAGPDTPLRRLAARVRSGDPDNLEAQAARRYWSLLFGPQFRRERSAGGINAQLNYGYTVLRSSVARAVVAAGLHPTVALHHANEGNAMRLVDDLIEPFRPLMDFSVYRLQKDGVNDVSNEAKRRLVETLYLDLPTPQGVTPVIMSIQRLAVSLAQYFLRERDDLDLPLAVLPLAWSR